jgi:hypothetical protein
LDCQAAFCWDAGRARIALFLCIPRGEEYNKFVMRLKGSHKPSRQNVIQRPQVGAADDVLRIY